MVTSVDAMGALSDVDRARLDRELEKPEVRKSLWSLANRFARSSQEATDLLHTAFLRVVDTSGAPWDPAGSKSLTLHVADIMSNLAANNRRSWKTKHEVVSHALAHDDGAVDGTPIPEDALVEIEGAAHWTRIREELLPVLDRDDAEAGAVLGAILKGVEGHAAIAAHAGVEIERVRLAYDRIKNRARALIRREMQREIERMKRGRAPSAKGTMKDQLS